MNNENPIEYGIAELMDEGAEVFLRKEDEAKERLIKFNCSSCRYAKVCNPKKGVEGFVIETNNVLQYPNKALTDIDLKRKIFFRCSKRKQRKTPIPFEETRIYKMAYKKEKKE